jgi:ABC-2 type transport system ATP-binding protein
LAEAIVARGLSKRYGDVAAVDELELSVEAGQLFGFLGPNGAGKTTTIRMALGLIHPSRGHIEILGERVQGGRAPLERVGALVEEPAFWKYLSGRKNLEYFARAGTGGDRAGTKRRLDRVDEVLDQVGLGAAADKRVKAYSQGMRQRLGVALALLGQPELLMLDEPTNGLDPTGMREMRLLMRRLADEGTTIFVSSHLLAEVELMCDRVGVMAQGRLVADGPPSLLRGPANRSRIQVDDVAKALAVLKHIAGAAASSSQTEGPGTLSVTLSQGTMPSDVNAALVSGGVRVESLIPERDTLEDVFLDLVEGVDVPR